MSRIIVRKKPAGASRAAPFSGGVPRAECVGGTVPGGYSRSMRKAARSAASSQGGMRSVRPDFMR